MVAHNQKGCPQHPALIALKKPNKCAVVALLKSPHQSLVIHNHPALLHCFCIFLGILLLLLLLLTRLYIRAQTSPFGSFFQQKFSGIPQFIISTKKTARAPYPHRFLLYIIIQTIKSCAAKFHSKHKHNPTAVGKTAASAVQRKLPVSL